MNKKKLPLAFWIFIGLVVGIAVGLALMMVPNGLDIAKNYILPWGTIFLNLLKFIVVPIVLFSIASGVISMQDIGRVGSVGGKTIVYYMCTTAFAVVLALVLASAAKGMHIFAAMETSGLAYEPPAGQSLMQTIIDIFPSNPITPLANASMLQVIVISLLVGFGILLAGEKGLVAAQVVDSFNEVSMKIMDLIIKLSPIGVACLICPVIVENGPKILAQLVAVLAVAYVGYIVHAVVVYSSTVKALGGVSPIAFFKGMAPAMMMAFSSASSVGTLPFTLECAEKLGLTRQVAARSQRMMRNFFGDSFFGGGFLDDFFAPMSSLMDRRSWLLDDPFADFFADMPALSAAPAQQEAQKQEKQDDLVGKEEQSRFSYLRQMNALRMEMKKAVHEENFERAAQLRDQIHQLEQQHKEQKESQPRRSG